jgi:hypothetical protein
LTLNRLIVLAAGVLVLAGLAASTAHAVGWQTVASDADRSHVFGTHVSARAVFADPSYAQVIIGVTKGHRVTVRFDLDCPAVVGGKRHHTRAWTRHFSAKKTPNRRLVKIPRPGDCELYVAARSGKGHLSLELQKPVF